MKNLFYISDSEIAINTKFLLSQGISSKSIKNWHERKKEFRIRIDNEYFFLYSAIPESSRDKIPTLEELIDFDRNEAKDGLLTHYREKVKKYIGKYTAEHIAYIQEYYPEVKDKDRGKAARLWSAWQYFVEYMQHIPYGESNLVRYLFNEMFDNKYKTQNYFSKSFHDMLRDGIEAHVIDNRSKGNNKGLYKYSEALWNRFAYYIQEDRKFPTAQIRRYLLMEFDANEVPCATMLRNKLKEWERNPAMYAKRYGAQKARQQMPFIPLKAPEYKNMQWQIDGFEIPFWVNGDKLFEKWVLVRVIDSCTRKIISSTVAKSETSLVILDTLQKAIIQEKCVPLELIMDKHSGTGTDGFKKFKTEVENLGCMVEITHDPTKKAYIERYNQYLNESFSEYPEWQGEGRAGKNPRRRSEEKTNELRKSSNMISPNEVIARGLFACEKFNERELAPIGNISPNKKSELTESKGIIIASEEQLMKLFTAPKEMKVTRGMIIMKHGIAKAHYIFSKENILKYNNTKVLVHYESFGSSIYVFDLKGHFVECLDPISYGSVSRRERSDTKQPMAKVGQNKHLQERTEKELEGLMENPESIEFIPSHLINKSAYAEIQQNLELKRLAKVEGLNIEPIEAPIVNIPGERHKRNYYSPDMDDNETAELGSIADLLKSNQSTNKK